MSINLKKDITLTIFSRALILLLNFAVVVATTRLWGDTGRGSIAIFVADLSIIGVLANVFTGSSVSYFFSRIRTSKLASAAYPWIFIVSAVSAIVLLLLRQYSIAPFVFISSVLLGIIAFNNSLFIGNQKIDHYNLITILQPAFLLGFMFLFHFLKPQFGYYCYFFGQILSLFVIMLICRYLRKRNGVILNWQFDKKATLEMLSFGWKTELSNLLQFLNYRLTFYLLDFYIGRGSVGVFSIGVTIAEAIWIVSRSMSMVQFSNVLKEGNSEKSRRETLMISTVSLIISAVCVVVVVLLPSTIFRFVFGEDFANVGQIVLWLSPGILFIAFSNVIGNFLSATRQLNILILKSAVGLLFTIVLAVILIPRMQIVGACIVNSCSYVVSSLILIVYFFFVPQR